MATVASLFGDQVEATRALDAIANSPFADVEMRVVEPALDDGGAGAVSGGALQELVAVFAGNEYPDLDDEAREWFIQGLQSGGTVVIAEVEDDRAAELESFFARLGGRTSKGD